MEPTPSQSHPAQTVTEVVAFDNSRRVVNSLTKLASSGNKAALLASEAVHGHSTMTGRLSIFGVSSLLDPVRDGKTQEKTILGRPTAKIAEDQVIEVESNVTAVTSFKLEPFVEKDAQEMFGVGCEDGTVHVYNYSANVGKSYNLKQQVAKETREIDDDSLFPQFEESSFEHHDAVVAVQAQTIDKQNVHLISASKDGHLILWRVRDNRPSDDLLTFLSELSLGIDEPITTAKWLDTNEVLVACVTGNLFQVSVEYDSQNIAYLNQKPKLVYTAEGNSAIFDIAVNKQEAILAEDSGKIVKLSFGQSVEVSLIHTLIRQSALCLGLDRLMQLDKKNPPLFLAVGSSKGVHVFKQDENSKFTLEKTLPSASDNVVSVKTVYNSEQKSALTLFSTADGRLQYFN